MEVVSGIGIWHMIRRIRRSGGENPDQFEKTALKITGAAFLVLTAGLVIMSIVNLYRGHKPESTFWGIVVSIVSIASMWALTHAKVKVGKELDSRAILADAACTRACLQLSVVLLVASAGYKITGIGGLDWSASHRCPLLQGRERGICENQGRFIRLQLRWRL